MDQSEFKWAWLTEHAPRQRAAVRFASVERITVAFLGARQIGKLAPGHQAPLEIDFDAIESFYFEGLPDLEECLSSGVLKFLEHSVGGQAAPHPTVPWLVTIDELMGDSPKTERLITGRADRKMFRTLVRKQDIDRTQLREYWHNHHKLMEMSAPFLGPWSMRTHVSFSLGLQIVGQRLVGVDDLGNEDVYDAALDNYYPVHGQAEPWATYENTPFPAEVRRDEHNFVDLAAPLRRAIVDEYIVADAHSSSQPR